MPYIVKRLFEVNNIVIKFLSIFNVFFVIILEFKIFSVVVLFFLYPACSSARILSTIGFKRIRINLNDIILTVR